MIESLTGTHADWAVGIARIVLGIIFFAHGAQKLLGWYDLASLAPCAPSPNIYTFRLLLRFS
jgi:uncharacterized membrane protein YphA (DoxX/SURF4 family)